MADRDQERGPPRRAPTARNPSSGPPIASFANSRPFDPIAEGRFPRDRITSTTSSQFIPAALPRYTSTDRVPQVPPYASPQISPISASAGHSTDIEFSTLSSMSDPRPAPAPLRPPIERQETATSREVPLAVDIDMPQAPPPAHVPNRGESTDSSTSLSTTLTLWENSDISSEGASHDDPTTTLRDGFGHFEVPPLARYSIFDSVPNDPHVRAEQQASQRFSMRPDSYRQANRISMHGDGFNFSDISLPSSIDSDLEEHRARRASQRASQRMSTRSGDSKRKTQRFSMIGGGNRRSQIFSMAGDDRQSQVVSMPAPNARKSVRFSTPGSDDSRQSQRISMHGDGIVGSTESLAETVEDAEQKFEKPQRMPRTGTTWTDKINPLKKSTLPAVPYDRISSREQGANWWSRLTFSWIAPLMSTGYERRLDTKDIWAVNPDRSAHVLHTELAAAFRKNLERGEKYPLFWALHDVLKREFWIGGACQFVANIFTVIAPYTLRYLITYATKAYIASKKHTTAPPIGQGIGLVIGITCMQILQSLGTNHFLYNGMMIGGQTRAVLVAAIFDKSMKLSGRAKAGGRALPAPGDNAAQNGEKVLDGKGQKRKSKKSKSIPDAAPGVTGDGSGWGSGKVLNLMAVDTVRIDVACGMIHMIWTAPICCIITLILLIVNLGPSALAGFAILFIGTPALTIGMKKLFIFRKTINVVNDERVDLTHEMFSAIKFVKYFSWEKAFMDQISGIRKRETTKIRTFLSHKNVIAAVSISLPVFATLVSVVTYSLSGHALVAAKIFSSVALFNALRMPLNLLPLIIGQATDAWASLERIQGFLLAEEIEDNDVFMAKAPNAVQIKHADFTWERNVTMGKGAKGLKPGQKGQKNQNDAKNSEKKDQKRNLLKWKGKPNVAAERRKSSLKPKDEKAPFELLDLNFSLGRNELVAVIGGVGSGKSSLRSALAGEMRRTEGHVIWGASKAFCAQYAWIQNTTVRNNILFGKEMDEDWYNQVIDACALRPDLDMLPEGDQTEIGEKGITMSGGQKQRLNIARAIYHDSEIVLMDDPLSAVDAHVGRHIFDNAIGGLLRNKCRVLATHQLQVLNKCDRIIWMDEGYVQAIDTFDNLMKTSEPFAQLMAATTLQTQEEQEEEADTVADTLIKKRTMKKKALAKKGVSMMQAEERAEQGVPWSLYSAYMRASGSIFNFPIAVVMLILAQGSNIVTSLWLSWWVGDKWHLNQGSNIGTYATLGVSQAVFMYLFSTILAWAGTSSSKTMLSNAMTRILHAPMSFFDTTPLGRITNRFSKDVDVMDYQLSDALRLYLITIANVTAIFILVITYFHYFAVAVAPLAIVFLLAAAYYRASARELKRYEATLRSTVFARFSEALSGTACIRAYGVQSRFVASLKDAIDEMDSAYFLTFANQRWLSVRLDCIGNTLVFVTGILVATNKFDVSPAISGLILSYILGIVQMLQYIVRQFADVENAMNSVERLHYYGTEVDQEAPGKLDPVDESWPQNGQITFNHVEMKYRPDLPLVLKGLTMNIRGGERIGVVGRTGAGKSSIMTALFRLTETSNGTITIDGQDIHRVGLEDLRSRLAIIPQDPNLFRGTIRSNLDPFNQHSDLELWSALRQADMAPPGADISKKRPGHVDLDGRVEEEGHNFSLGQRQLLALARALVRGSQIIICDEATSSVDMETDAKIQKTMQEQFRNKTMMVIAHRLRTIINYDRICVMDQGRIAEMDTPRNLYLHDGIFKSMCDENHIRFEEITGP